MNGIAPVPGNFTYLTRNFATLGPFMLFRSALFRAARELQRLPLALPAYRYADRTVSSARMGISGAWRTVSEDSLADCSRVFPADCPHLMDCHCRSCRGEYQRILGVSSI